MEFKQVVTVTYRTGLLGSRNKAAVCTSKIITRAHYLDGHCETHSNCSIHTQTAVMQLVPLQ